MSDADILNTLYNTNTQVNIVDLKDQDGNGAGARVILRYLFNLITLTIEIS